MSVFVSGFVQSDFVAVHVETLVGAVSGRDVRTENRQAKIMAHTGSTHNRYVSMTRKQRTSVAD